MLPKRLCAP
ncbi:hypothetical protein Celaphus_00011720 [Cervus elaphus hippelaphus]|uniref:Uncharacterized protein n=1 Tax=Cervus elaphus hippelaphus TaxID=46360 RepID=A0A212DFS4_CEREH|nr:hypothetical protein Celaphus_00011720 [Cervus elaphus hippelaphus]